MTGLLRAAIAALALGFATAAAPPEDEPAFTRDMAERIRAAVPARPVAIEGPLQLRVGSGDDSVEVNVGRIFAFCATAAAEECEDARVRYAAAVGDMAAAQAPIRREQLRVALRSGDWCDELARSGAAGAPRPLTRAAAPGLCAVLMADYPSLMRGVSAEDLAGLELDAAAGWSLAERQTRSELPRPDDLSGLAEGLVVVTGYDYAPSLLLDPSAWSATAARYPDLVVAVPGDDSLIAVRRSLVTDWAEFRRAVRDHFDTAERGLSPVLYRWTPGGWAAVD